MNRKYFFNYDSISESVEIGVTDQSDIYAVTDTFRRFLAAVGFDGSVADKVQVIEESSYAE